MPAANIMYVDVGINDVQQGVVYAIDDGGYLYTALLKPTARDMAWVKGKMPIPSTASAPNPPLSVLGLMKVYKQAVYLVDDPGGDGSSTLYVTSDLAGSWHSSPLPKPPSGDEYDQDMYVTDKFMLLASAGEPGALMKSTDQGASWSPIFQQPLGIRTIYCDDKIVAVGGYGEISVATVGDMDDPANWRTFSHAQDARYLLDEQISKIYFDHRDHYSVIYLVQDSAVAYGKVSIGSSVGIVWNPPFENIKDYMPDATDFFVFGDVILETITTSDESVDRIGKFTSYRVNGAELPASRNYITEAGRWNNPYANFSSLPMAGSALRIFNPPAGGAAYKLYLSDGMVLSMSSNGGKDWQKVTINT